MPKVSIGLPVYNGDNFLKEAIDSFLNQTFRDFELIITDNASTDNTETICRQYAASDKRIIYHRHNKNLGAAYNYNHGFNLAKGQYFKWAAHDDVCAPTYLEECVAILESNSDIVLCYPQTVIIDEAGEKVKFYNDDLHLPFAEPFQRFAYYQKNLRAVGERNPIFGLIRLDALKCTPLIGSFVASDVTLLGELALHGQFYELPSRLFFRRDHVNTSVRSNPELNKRIAWFDVKKKDKITLTRWRWFYEYLKAIFRVRMNFKNRLFCLFEMGKWFRYHIRGLLEDLTSAFAQLTWLSSK
ncbi:glycosyltransferase family 2 protein [candidate division KSB1 bacterium]|nr:glycosyltransferase family 2 protein [candidate division KSB1 bacterium]